MKFGKRLQAQMFPEWSLYYIHYKRLKQQLKQEYCEFGPFAKLLASELLKVNDFYGTQSRRLVATLRHLSGVAQEGKTSESERLQFRQFCIDVNRLRSYVMLNYMAVIKIVKKWNKRGTQGQSVLDAFSVLQATPFYQSRSLGMLVVRAEMLALCFSPETPIQCKDWSCPICLDILCNPVVLDCGHRFCWSCITTALEQVDQCPVCRKRLMLEHGDLKVDMWLQDFMEHNWPAKDPISNGNNGHPGTASTMPTTNGVSVKKEKTRKSLLIGIAGLKTECLLLSKVEGLKKIIASGKYCMTAKSVSVMSSTNWASILTGVDFTKRTTDHVLDTKGHNFLSTLRKQGYQTAAIGSSKTAHKLLSEASLLSTDKEVYDNTIELLSGAAAPDVVFAHFGTLEKIGKSASFSPTEPSYMKALEELDGLLTKVLESVQNRPSDEEWMIMLVSEPCADEDPTSEQEPGILVVLHPSMEAGEIVPTPHVTDVGPTMLYYFSASSSASLPELDGRCLPLYDPQLPINSAVQNQKSDNNVLDNPEINADDDCNVNNAIEDEDFASTVVSSEHTGAGKLDATQYRSLYSSTLEALKKVLTISETLNQHISVLQKVTPVVVHEESNPNSRKAWSTVIKHITKQDHSMEYFQDLPAKVASLARQVLRQSCILNRRWTKLSRELEEYIPPNKDEAEPVHNSRTVEQPIKNEKYQNGGGGGGGANRRKNEKGKVNNTPPNNKGRVSPSTNPSTQSHNPKQQPPIHEQASPQSQSISPANIAALYAQMLASQQSNPPTTFNDPSIALYGGHYYQPYYDPRVTPPGNPTYGHSDPSMTFIQNHPGNSVAPPRGFNMYPPWSACMPNSQ